MLIIDKMAEETERSDIRYIKEKAARVEMTTTEYLLYMIFDELEGIQTLFTKEIPE